MTLDELLPRLDSIRQRGYGRWSARCPAHTDKSPSLSISEGEKGILLKCWAGCTVEEICRSFGIEQRDLFFDVHDKPQRRHQALPVRIDRRAVAFRFELTALDLRCRAERIAQTGKLQTGTLTDVELDRALTLIARGYADLVRAELFEGVADDLRLKEFLEKDHARHKRVA